MPIKHEDGTEHAWYPEERLKCPHCSLNCVSWGLNSVGLSVSTGGWYSSDPKPLPNPPAPKLLKKSLKQQQKKHNQ